MHNRIHDVSHALFTSCGLKEFYRNVSSRWSDLPYLPLQYLLSTKLRGFNWNHLTHLFSNTVHEIIDELQGLPDTELNTLQAYAILQLNFGLEHMSKTWPTDCCISLVELAVFDSFTKLGMGTDYDAWQYIRDIQSAGLNMEASFLQDLSRYNFDHKSYQQLRAQHLQYAEALYCDLTISLVPNKLLVRPISMFATSRAKNLAELYDLATTTLNSTHVCYSFPDPQDQINFLAALKKELNINYNLTNNGVVYVSHNDHIRLAQHLQRSERGIMQQEISAQDISQLLDKMQI